MNPVETFASELRNSGLTNGQIASIVGEKGLPICPEAIDAWLRGDVAPGNSVLYILVSKFPLPPERRQEILLSFIKTNDPILTPPVDRLLAAVETGDPAAVKSFLTTASLYGGVSIDGRNADKETALGLAARSGFTGVARLLMEYGASPSAFCRDQECAFHVALAHGDDAMIADFLEFGASSTSPNMKNQEPLEILCLAGKPKPDAIRSIVQKDRSSGAVFAKAARAAAKTGVPENLKAIIDLGAPAKDVLDAAIAGGSVECVKIIRAQGFHTPKASIEELVSDLPAPQAAAMKEFLHKAEAKRYSKGWYNPDAPAIKFIYTKADGLGFDPSRLDSPILFGGDYDGMGAYPARHVKKFFMPYIEQMKCGWFEEFIDKIINDEDFTLEELKEAARRHGFRV